MAAATTEGPRTVRCTAWAEPVDDPAALAGREGVLAVDVVDRDRLHLLVERGMRADPRAWTRLVWCAPGADLGGSPLLDLPVHRHPGWGDPDAGGSGSVLMVSLVASATDLDHPTFVARYRNHARIAAQHHGFAAYRQNVATSGGVGPAAVSEILLASEADWRDRFYSTPGSAGVIGADVAQFLDLRATASTLVRRYVGTRGGMLSGCDG